MPDIARANPLAPAEALALCRAGTDANDDTDGQEIAEAQHAVDCAYAAGDAVAIKVMEGRLTNALAWRYPMLQASLGVLQFKPKGAA